MKFYLWFKNSSFIPTDVADCCDDPLFEIELNFNAVKADAEESDADPLLIFTLTFRAIYFIISMRSSLDSFRIRLELTSYKDNKMYKMKTCVFSFKY